MLLPYLTDTLGIAAVAAGFIVFLPKAWDVVLNPIAGRISDRSTDPRGPRRPFLLKGGLSLAVCFALLFAAPDLGSKAIDALWVLVMFVACATAYAFFQVPYVAMPAEITDSYDERTRLMTWRVAILALAIMISGASAPAIRDALGGRAGYRVMGVVVAVLLVIGVVGAYVGTRRAPIGRVAPGAGTLREQLRIVASSPRLPAAADHLRDAGARDRGDARRRRLRLALGAGRQGRGHDPVRLLRRAGAAADAGVERAGPADRQEEGVRRVLARARDRGACC